MIATSKKKHQKSKRDFVVFLAQVFACCAVWLGYEIYCISGYVLNRAFGITSDFNLGITGAEMNATRVTACYSAFGVSGVYLFYVFIIGLFALMIFCTCFYFEKSEGAE